MGELLGDKKFDRECIQPKDSNYTIFTTINLCRQLNGRSLGTALHLSFMVLIHLSISKTCCFVAKMLTTVLTINQSLVESNSRSIKIVCTIIIPLEYNLIIIFSFLVNCLAVRVGMCLTVTNLISRYFVIKKRYVVHKHHIFYEIYRLVQCQKSLEIAT